MGHLYVPRKGKIDIIHPPLVSVIIPAHNEEVGIAKTINSLLDSEYRDLEIIVVDDGSTDRTYEVATKIKKSFSDDIVVIKSMTNRGKASALNTGILNAKGEIVITIDADSYVKPGSILELVRALSDPRYNVATGNVIIGNPNNLVSLVQYFEYVFGFHFKKTQFINDSLYIFPGAITAFRKSAVIDVGLFEGYSVTEDFDISLKLVNSGNKVIHVNEAVCVTEGASTFKGLVDQRTRWRHGYFQCLRKRRSTLDRNILGFYLYYIELPLGFFGILELLLFPLLVILLFTQIVIHFNPLVFLVYYLLLPFACLLLIFGKIENNPKRYIMVLTVPILFFVANTIEFIALLKALFRFSFNKETQWTKWERVGV